MKQKAFGISARIAAVVLAAVLLASAGACRQGAANANQVKFTFVANMPDGTVIKKEISTDKTTVGEALLEKGLIAGETSTYGLVVQTINGVTRDWNVDGTYWAFYIDGEYAMTGVDSTPIKAGSVYEFKPE